MKKISIYLILFLLVSSFVMASSLDITTRSIKRAIDTNEEAIFELDITNKGQLGDFRANYDGLEWYVTPVSFSLGRDETETIIIKVKPLYVNIGQHSIPLNIKNHKTDESEIVNLIVNIKDQVVGDYLPTVAVKIDLPSEVFTNESVDINMNFKNRNPLFLNNMSIIIESIYFSKTEYVTLNSTDLNQVSEDNIFNSFELDVNTPPQDLIVNFKIILKNDEIYQSNRIVKILEFSPKFKIEENVEKSFFKRSNSFNVTNVGNVPRTETHKIEISLFSQLFTHQIPESSLLKEEGNRYLMWTIELKPGESTQYHIITNYRTFLIAIFIICLVMLFYFMLRSQLTIIKSAKVLELKDDGISMLQVMLTLKNISGNKIKLVNIQDTIPHMADYVKEEHVGSMAPSKVFKHERKGTTLVWEIEDFDSFEERIISYKIKTRLNILGGLSLKSASGKFKIKDRTRVTKSSSLSIVINKNDQNEQ